MKIVLLVRMRSCALIASVLVAILGCSDSRATYIQALENKAYSIDTEGLMHAVSYGYYADAKMLLEAGVSPDSVSRKTGNHMPPLVKAAIVGDDRIITLLLEYKADINAASQEGLTPLLAAINANNLSSAILLLNAKPDLSVVGPKHAYSALHTAARRGHASLVKRLIELGADVNRPNEFYKRYTPLIAAIVYKHDDVAVELIKHGANVAFFELPDDTMPLQMAVSYKRWRVLDAMLNALPDDLSKMQAYQVAEFAIEQQNSRLLENVLAKNPEVLGVNEKTRPNLLWLSRAANDVEAFRACLKAGANPNTMDLKYNESLLFTTLQYAPNFAMALLEYDVSASLTKNSEKHTQYNAYKYAVDAKDMHLLKAILNYRGKSAIEKQTSNLRTDAMFFSIKRRMSSELKLAMVKAFAESGVNLAAKSHPLQMTPLIAAADKGEYTLVKWLLEQGVNINATTHYGGTAMIQAAMNGYADVVELLVNEGADVKPKTTSGFNAASSAAHHSHPDVVKLLAKYGLMSELKQPPHQYGNVSSAELE